MSSSPGAVILLVEDDPNDVLFLKRALAEAGVRQELRVASDGEEAVAYLSGQGAYADRAANPLPCVVVMDLKLPRRGGLEVLRWLRGQDAFRELPVVMVSSSDIPRDRDEARRNGADDYRVKPVSFQELVRMARELRDQADEHCPPGGR